MTQSTPRVWLSEFDVGFLSMVMVEDLLRNGEIAVAALCKPSILDDPAAKYPRTVLPLDVTNETQVKSVFEQANDAFGHIGVVYNNVGRC
ncbi:hypothetical protein AZE42_06711 [Rhizopogon vesiculosus]|uniref:Ketoreductase (KR) domain-containing protein n=1 Tax=Rhizopogon vesiculosus TaxID=180088 RepID=A0A1J8QCL1_9AGAM|nr:hypothetical protein AZE42_06711 [Rhizopogon vesiculosus]